MSDSGARPRVRRFHIELDNPLPAFNQGGAQAYAVTNNTEYRDTIYALLCPSNMPLRLEMGISLQNTTTHHFHNLIDFEIVHGSGLTEEYMGLILPKPLGRPLVADLNTHFIPWKEEELRQYLIKPMVEVLNTLHDRVLSHGSISPLQMWREGAAQPVKLAQCFTTLPGLNQPVFFETIERAIAQPFAKGDGRTEDDLFSLGATIYFLAVGRNPLAHLSPEELIRARMEISTPVLLLNTARVPSSLSELVKGLLSDQQRSRLTIRDVMDWCDGQRLVPKQPVSVGKAKRSIIFNGQEFLKPTLLAQALASAPEEAIKFVLGPDFLRWCQRSGAIDVALYQKLAEVLGSSENGKSPAVTLTQVIACLDPAGPLRYKEFSFGLAGIGTAAMLAFLQNNANLKNAVAEIVQSDLPSFWAGLPGNSFAFNTTIAQELSALRHLITQTQPGYGLERMLYTLNRQLPCQSETCHGFYALQSRDLLRALDGYIQKGQRPQELLDRHSAAFLGSRHNSRSDENLLKLLNPSQELGERRIGLLKLLATLQARFKLGPLTHLTGWLAELVRPSLDNLHSQTIKEDIAKSLLRVAKHGDLNELLALLDSGSLQLRDQRLFKSARQEYQNLQKQINEIDQWVAQKDALGHAVGRQVASVTAVVLALLATVVIMLAQKF